MKGYPLDQLHEEIAFLAYYLHWDFATLMNMEHRQRQRWCKEVSRMNLQLSNGRAGTPLEA